MHSDRAGLYDEARIRHTGGSKCGRSFGQLPCCHAAYGRDREAAERRCGTGSRPGFAVRNPTSFPQADVIQDGFCGGRVYLRIADEPGGAHFRSEEHTSELQSRRELVCRLLLDKKKEGSLMFEAATLNVQCSTFNSSISEDRRI